MQALYCTSPRNIEYKEINSPTLSKGNTILKIRRVGICGTDYHAYEGNQPFFNYPRILGHELAAEIFLRDELSDFEVGEAVTIIPYFNCGICIACRTNKPNCCVTIKVCGVHIDGGMVEYLSVPSHSLVHGNGLSYDELALVEPLAIGAHGVRRAGVQPNDYVLVIGAGPIGLGTIEFARIAGGKVIVMDINETRLSFCQNNLRVPFVLNPLKEDAFSKLKEITNGDMPNIVIDCTGSLKAINNGFQFMAHGGCYVLIGLQKGDLMISHPEFHKREGTLMSSRNATREDFIHVMNCMKNKLVNPTNYITHRLNFSEVKSEFESLIHPESCVIKAIISL